MRTLRWLVICAALVYAVLSTLTLARAQIAEGNVAAGCAGHGGIA